MKNVWQEGFIIGRDIFVGALAMGHEMTIHILNDYRMTITLEHRGCWPQRARSREGGFKLSNVLDR